MWFSLQKSISLKKKKEARRGRVNTAIILHLGKSKSCLPVITEGSKTLSSSD